MANEDTCPIHQFLDPCDDPLDTLLFGFVMGYEDGTVYSKHEEHPHYKLFCDACKRRIDAIAAKRIQTLGHPHLRLVK